MMGFVPVAVGMVVGHAIDQHQRMHTDAQWRAQLKEHRKVLHTVRKPRTVPENCRNCGAPVANKCAYCGTEACSPS